MINTRLIILLIILSFQYFPTKAETTHGSPNAWFMAMLTLKTDSPWHAGAEYHLRKDNWIEPQQNLFRPYIGYRLSDDVDFAFGYSFIQTHPYGDFPLADDVSEHNIWEQITVNGKLGELKLSHRYRLENRFIEDLTVIKENNETGYAFTNRFRYRLTATYPIKDNLYAAAFNEIWFNLKGLFPKRFDRNWLYAGLGYKVDDLYDIQLGYMHQWIQNNPTRFEEHPTLMLSVFYNIQI